MNPRRLFLLSVAALAVLVILVTAIVTHGITPEQVTAGCEALFDVGTVALFAWLALRALGLVLDYAAKARTAPPRPNVQVREPRERVTVRSEPPRSRRETV